LPFCLQCSNNIKRITVTVKSVKTQLEIKRYTNKLHTTTECPDKVVQEQSLKYILPILSSSALGRSNKRVLEMGWTKQCLFPIAAAQPGLAPCFCVFHGCGLFK